MLQPLGRVIEDPIGLRLQLSTSVTAAATKQEALETAPIIVQLLDEIIEQDRIAQKMLTLRQSRPDLFDVPSTQGPENGYQIADTVAIRLLGAEDCQ
jgi:hypothetical protein